MHLIFALFLTNWYHYFYIPAHGPWYLGNVWGNFFIGFVVIPLGWLWSKTKFWPLRPISHGIEHLHTKLDEHIASQKEHREHQHNHNEWMAKHLAVLYEHHMGEPPEDHPQFAESVTQHLQDHQGQKDPPE